MERIWLSFEPKLSAGLNVLLPGHNRAIIWRDDHLGIVGRCNRPKFRPDLTMKICIKRSKAPMRRVAVGNHEFRELVLLKGGLREPSKLAFVQYLAAGRAIKKAAPFLKNDADCVIERAVPESGFACRRHHHVGKEG